MYTINVQEDYRVFKSNNNTYIFQALSSYSISKFCIENNMIYHSVLI